MALRIVATAHQPSLVSLPWHVPLDEWDDRVTVSLPRGLSRHIVRFVRLDRDVYAVKETREAIAWREYRLLRDLHRIRAPAVEPVGVVTGREGRGGDELEACLVTRQLSASMPYRELLSRGVRADTMPRLVDAMVVLITKLHLSGFFWGDCSFSNTLFRRSAGEFAAYLVDAETGELHRELSVGQRMYDLDTARGNLFGELLDLRAGGFLGGEINPHDVVDGVLARYSTLWGELTGPEDFNTDEMWRMEQRVARLNDMGFEVEELDIITDWDGASVRIQPKVVEAGHHRRVLQGLTGLDVQDNQARRLLNDLNAFTATHGLQQQDRAQVAQRWLTEIFEPIVAMAPPRRRTPLEAAEVFHEILEHRWYLSERAGHEIDVFETAHDYFAHQPAALPTASTAAVDELPDAVTAYPGASPDQEQDPRRDLSASPDVE